MPSNTAASNDPLNHQIKSEIPQLNNQDLMSKPMLSRKKIAKKPAFFDDSDEEKKEVIQKP